MKIPLRDLVGHLEVEDPELDPGDMIVDAFVVVRFLRTDSEQLHTAYAGTDGMRDTASQLGTLTLVLDHLRESARRNWDGDQ